MTGRREKKIRRRTPYLGEALPLVLIALVGILIGYLMGITAQAAEEPPAVYRVIVPHEVAIPAPEPLPELEPEPAVGPELVSLGEFTVTYYCCERRPHICGTGDGLTATGIPVEPGVCAVDPEVIPLGSTVIVDGTSYLAADVGGAVRGNHIDIAVEDHSTALSLGVQSAEVWIIPVCGEAKP